MVIRVSDKTQNYSKVTKLLVKPYFISSSVFIKKATAIRNAGGFCTIRFSDGNCGTFGTRVRESKLYRT